MKQGVGIHKTDDKEYIKRNYSAVIQKNQLIKVVEKPKKVPNNLCGMGIYFFDNSCTCNSRFFRTAILIDFNTF